MGPFVNDEYSDVTFALYAVEAPGMPPRLLTREAEKLRQRLLHVAGVKKVDILGERPERIFVEFSYARLATLGIGARDIFDALQRQNAVTPAGSIDTNGPQVFVRLEGAYDDLQKIRDTPIVSGGRTLKLSDVAEVERGYEDPATFLIRHNGEPALMLGIVMQDGWNGLDLGKALEAETEADIARSCPPASPSPRSRIRRSTSVRPSMNSCSSSSSPWLWSWWSVWSAWAGASASWSRQPCR